MSGAAFPYVSACAKMSGVVMSESVVPAANAEDDDDVVVALETARVSAERKDIEAAVKWLHRAASAARRQGRPHRAGILSRSAAKLGAAEKFERKEEGEKVFSEISEDDFAENTIVESAAEIAAKGEAEKSSKKPVRGPNKIPIMPDQPTPVAPLTAQSRAVTHQAVRVAVKRVLGGNFEARPLGPNESAAPGESEALLVPVEGGKKLS